MIDFKEIAIDGEVWELFTRDFLQANGFFIESTVDRGPDGKKDLIVSELLEGNLGNYKFRWLVSCKHFATSNRSVREEDEPNILERVKGFDCEGFIGFYSTVPSAALNTRLVQLRDNRQLKDYRIFDYKLIENYLIRIGFSQLLMRYFPLSYKSIKPLHLILSEYQPLNCAHCHKDILQMMYTKTYGGIVASVIDRDSNPNVRIVKDFYCACKGECDWHMQNFYREQGYSTQWEDLGDLAIPTMFIRYILTTMNQINSDGWQYDNLAFNKEKEFIISLSQKVLREATEEEKFRAVSLLNSDFY